MAQAIPLPADCCTPCDEIPNVQVPGPAGAAGDDGDDGTDGVDSYTYIVGEDPMPVMPAQLANVTITVGTNVWMVPGQMLFIGSDAQAMGHLQVVSVDAGGAEVTVKNVRDDATGAYPDNVAAATAFVAGMKVSPAGIQGASGAAAAGYALDDLSNVVPATGRAALDLKAIAIAESTAADRFWYTTAAETYAEGTITAAGRAILDDANAAAQIATLSAILAAFAGLTPLADRLPYFTGPAAMALATLDAYVRGALDSADINELMEALEGLSGQGRGGAAVSLDLNVIGDTAIAVPAWLAAAGYVIRRVTLFNPSGNANTAEVAMYTNAAGGGTEIIAPQPITELSGITKFKDLTLEAIAGTDVFTNATLYARVTTVQGVAMTCSLNLFVDEMHAP